MAAMEQLRDQLDAAVSERDEVANDKEQVQIQASESAEALAQLRRSMADVSSKAEALEQEVQAAQSEHGKAMEAVQELTAQLAAAPLARGLCDAIIERVARGSGAVRVSRLSHLVFIAGGVVVYARSTKCSARLFLSPLHVRLLLLQLCLALHLCLKHARFREKLRGRVCKLSPEAHVAGVVLATHARFKQHGSKQPIANLGSPHSWGPDRRDQDIAGA